MSELQTAPLTNGPMFNAYPDSIGGTLAETVQFLGRDGVRGAFASAYLLPSVFNTDLDRGFSVIDYGLNECLATPADLEGLRALGIGLKLDFLLNHASVLSPQFQDILTNGEASPYRDFFIDWNRFWEGRGRMTEGGYIQPDEAEIRDMFMRKPGLPLLMVRFPDGRRVPYWNTFYQEVRYPRVDEQDLIRVAGLQYAAAQRLAAAVNRALDAGQAPEAIDFGQFGRMKPQVTEWLEAGRKYLGLMDLNIRSPLVWDYYDRTLATLAGYGAQIVRLDAFAYAPKAPGKRNFLNEPDTWELLARVRALADRYGLTLLPEIHASYAEKTYARLAREGYPCYDFFLPGLVIDALERQNGDLLARWAQEQVEKGIRSVTMLGCHDGIPLLDLKGLLTEEQIEALIRVVVGRGGLVKDLHGQKNVYYQVNATYFSALGEDERRLLLARAIHLFMPGKPQVWYLDLFAGRNDLAAARGAGAAGHKEINRTNLTAEAVERALQQPVVQDQLTLLRFRNACPAFGFDAALDIARPSVETLRLTWRGNGCEATLDANLRTLAFTVETADAAGERAPVYRQA
ncbi:MAG: glycosidase [Clostridiales bacterium]|nr:glycosidase [Clostridiales bacterium]